MGRIWCSLYISGFKNAKLVIDGPYSLCRNPLYLFSYLGGVGIMLITETFIFPIVFTLYFLYYYHFVIRQEEAFLSEKYGTAYSDYIKTIPRFYQVSKILKSLSSIRFHRSISVFLTQVVWFIWVAALVQLLMSCDCTVFSLHCLVGSKMK